MKSLIDCTVQGQRSVLIRDHIDNQATLFPNKTSYEMVREGLRQKGDFIQIARDTFAATSVRMIDIDIGAYHPPLKPSDDREAMVSAFGNTHVDVNGRPARAKDLDWFFKGNGATVITTGDPIRLGMHAYGGGIEIEYAMVLMGSSDGTPVVIGYVLANDFSDVEMRRRHPNLASLSKLTYTAISHNLVLADDIPQNSNICCKVFRGRPQPAWISEGVIGRCVMKYTTNYLIETLFQHHTMRIPPFSVHYLLLGAALSSNKAGFELKHRDIISADCDVGQLSIESSFEDEAVAMACC